MDGSLPLDQLRRWVISAAAARQAAGETADDALPTGGPQLSSRGRAIVPREHFSLHLPPVCVGVWVLQNFFWLSNRDEARFWAQKCARPSPKTARRAARGVQGRASRNGLRRLKAKAHTAGGTRRQTSSCRCRRTGEVRGGAR